MRTIRLVLVMMALVAAACSAEPAADVADFSEILAGEITITPDPSGTTATLRVATTIDAVCAVAYGETDALGSLATDSDMSGGAHDEHTAVMTGLQPDTEYRYRLQGVGVDGRLYRSGLMTFRTPPASGASGLGRNVAVEATVADVSSEFSASFAAANAIDGDRGTEWSSRGDGDDAFITLDLGRSVDIAGVGFLTREMSDGSSITTSFTVAVDGQTFGPFEAGPGMALAELSATGQIVRIDVETSTGGNTGAVEIEVYE